MAAETTAHTKAAVDAAAVASRCRRFSMRISGCVDVGPTGTVESPRRPRIPSAPALLGPR